jgi:uncharacterized protein (TIGR02246 family)
MPDTPPPGRPDDVPAAFAAAWNARDPDALAALFDEDAEFVNVVGLWWHDRDAIRRAHAYGLARIFQHSALRVGVVRVKALGAGVAVVHARMHLDGQTAVDAVARPAARTTIFSFVVRLADGGWRCAAAHNTDVVPGAETNVIDDTGRLRPADYRRPGAPD